jgi:hypothetical protein
LAFYLGDNEWARSHQWLIPVLWSVSGASFLFAAIRTRRFRSLFGASEQVREKFRQEIHGSGNRTAGRDNIEIRLNEPGVATGPLMLTFDATDNQCVRRIDGVPREYRVRTFNSTGIPAPDVEVRIEGTVPELQLYAGVRLRARHSGSSSVSLPNGAAEYFNLLEYNPMDHAIDRPVLHVCHSAPALPINVAVDNYEFTLRAYSANSISEPITLRFEQLYNGHSQLVRIP